MRLITCAGFYGSGSSAVTDYFSEYDDVFTLEKYEYRFVQDPDTISDLEYNIVENNHRHNTSHAIKRFIKTAKKMTGIGYPGAYKIFGDDFKRLTDKYVDDITELKTKAWWHIDRIDRGNLFIMLDLAYSVMRRLLSGGLKTEKRFSMLRGREDAYFSAISEEEFLAATRKYIDSLMGVANRDNKPFVMVDQLVPPTNVERFIRYFNDIKVVVVDRDPRDVYLVEKTKLQRGVIPIGDVRDYVKWFQITRRHAKETKDSDRILKIRFEDMIYRYDEMADRLREFAGLSRSAWIHPKTGFTPERSVKNTNLREAITKYEEDIRYIERMLPEYLYDFGTCQ